MVPIHLAMWCCLRKIDLDVLPALFCKGIRRNSNNIVGDTKKGEGVVIVKQTV